MLNELHVLNQSLQRCGLKMARRHPDVKQPGRKAGLVVNLDKNSKIGSLEYRDADKIAALWTTSEGNHNSFPVMKLQRPIWGVPTDDPVRQELEKCGENDIAARVRLLRKAGQRAKINFGKGENAAWDRLRKRVASLILLFTDKDPKFAALQTLMKRFTAPGLSGEDFLSQLARATLDHCDNGSLADIDLVETLLLGQLKQNEYRAEIPLILDIEDFDRFDCRVASSKMEPFVSACLLSADNSDDTEKGICSLTGQTVAIESDKFPNPNLPVIGITYLMSMNENVPCQNRYGLSSTRIFPTGRSLAREMQDALLFLTDDSQQFKTWQAVPSSKPKEQDLLIIYLEDNPKADIKKAAALCRNQSEARFSAIASRVCDALRGKSVSKNSLLRLFVLRKADPARRQVVLSQTWTVGNILTAADNWQKAAANIPEFSVPLPSKKGQKAVHAEPECPFPSDLVTLLQKEWVQGGTRCNDVSGCSLHQAFALFLKEPPANVASVECLLRMTLHRTTSLLCAIGGAAHLKQIEAWKQFSPDARRTALEAIVTLGILLHKLGRRKERYMNEMAYKLGQLLAVADTLHKSYCQVIRKGQIPPQLIGNALLTVAASSPKRTLDRLLDRWRIYCAWATKEKWPEVIPEESEQKARAWAIRSAKGALKNGSELSRELHETDLDHALTDSFKAELLLGYLAGPDSKTVQTTENKPKEEV